jgi:hypothetical protein
VSGDLLPNERHRGHWMRSSRTPCSDCDIWGVPALTTGLRLILGLVILGIGPGVIIFMRRARRALSGFAGAFSQPAA